MASNSERLTDELIVIIDNIKPYIPSFNILGTHTYHFISLKIELLLLAHKKPPTAAKT